MKTKYIIAITFSVLVSLSFMSSCSDKPDRENYYTFTKEMISDYLQNREETYSDFIYILNKSKLMGMMATYGTYTCFAPTNSAVEDYLKNVKGVSSVTELSDEDCDTIAWNHIIKKAFFTTDLSDGNFPMANMNDRYLTFSCDNDSVNDGNIAYYVNKLSRIVVRDDSVENGVVHTIDHIIQPSSQYLPELIADNPQITLFAEALALTGLKDSLYEYIDENYHCGTDSVNKGFTYSRVGETGHFCKYIGKRMKRYSAFIETDSIYHANGIMNIDDLFAYAKRVYDAVYPKDAGSHDNDFKDRKNPLNRFVAYHLLPYYGSYNDWTISESGIDYKTTCAVSSKIDCTDWYTTLMPGTILKMSSPSAGLFINRKGVGTRATVPGVKVFSPSEIGNVEQQALNGIIHYIDNILVYDVRTRDVVFNDRIRINAITLSPEFMNCGARGTIDNATGFKQVEGWDFHGQSPRLMLRERGVWMATYSDAVDLTGQFDISFKLPPVPENTYEIRFAVGISEYRGAVQVFFGEKHNMQPMGLPIDFRIWGADPSIGWIEDTGDEDADRAVDKAMHNRGWMKEMDTWLQGGSNNLRDNNGKLRKVLCTQTMSPDKEYWLRIRLVIENSEAELPINYIELCPKSVYAGLTAEDTH